MTRNHSEYLNAPNNCPFCGDDSPTVDWHADHDHWVQCTHCLAAGPPANSRDLAVANWNTAAMIMETARAVPPQTLQTFLAQGRDAMADNTPHTEPCPFCTSGTMRIRNLSKPYGEIDLICTTCGYRSPTGRKHDVIQQHNYVANAVQHYRTTRTTNTPNLECHQ